MTKKSRIPVNGAGLHNFVATGGVPSQYRGTKGLSSKTVPNAPKQKNAK